MNNKNQYNLVVIGGGPAGMMAAGRAAELGARVLLLEKNQNLGVKLMITGKGRCNITNIENEPRKLVEKYGPNGKFLFSALSKFNTNDTIEFFENLGVATKTERGGRVFPENDLAKTVLDALKKYLKLGNVEIKTGIAVKQIQTQENKIQKIILENGEEIMADNYLIATGGKSYPKTGATGSGYDWLKKMGHKIITPKPALTPIIVKEKWIKDLEGLSLKNVEASLWNNKKIASRFGEAVFTDNGLSGPIILDLSKTAGENLNKILELRLDFKPALDYETLDKRLQKDFTENNKKMFKNSLDELLPQKLIPIIIELSQINPEKKTGEITKLERKNLLHLLKDFSLTVSDLVGFEKAIITTGGVDIKEVDPKTCKSKIISNLYLAGEILDIDGPTGGFNLQVCWSTGRAAGEAIAANLD